MNGIILNEDPSNYFMCTSPEKALDPKELLSLPHHYCHGAVQEVAYTVNARLASFNSKVLESVWSVCDFPEDGSVRCRGKQVTCETERNWALNTRALYMRGIDPYRIWLEETRRMGRKAWLSIRVNDIHSVDEPDGPLVSEFWRRHHDYWRCQHREMEEWIDRAMDFAHPEVQKQLLDFVQEVLERYAPDGLELDWMRFGYHFQAGFEAEGRVIITELHRRIRSMVDDAALRCGHPIRVAARIAGHPEDAYALGYDAFQWAKDGLVDRLTPCPFWWTFDTSIPVNLWKQLLPPSVELAPGIEVLCRPCRRLSCEWTMYIEPAMLRALAASYAFQGADKLYFMNIMDRFPVDHFNTTLAESQETCGDDVTAQRGTRRHIVTFTDTPAPGKPDGNALPREILYGHCGEFRLPIGSAPSKNRSAEVRIGLETASPGQKASIFLNGNKLAPLEGNGDVLLDSYRVNPSAYPGRELVIKAVKKIVRFNITSLLKDGDNVIEVDNLDKEKPLRVIWCEIKIG